MNVYFDMTPCVFPNTGIASFSNEILTRMIAQHKDLSCRGAIMLDSMTLRYGGKIKDYPFPIKRMILPTKIFNSPKSFGWPSYSFFSGAHQDLSVFWANYVPPFPLQGKVVTVIHDLNPLYTETGNERESYASCIKRTLNVSDRIITVSEYSKRDIADKFDYPLDMISVVYNGADISRYSQDVSDDEIARIKKKYAIDGDFFLYLGSTRRNKNITAILAAIKELPDEIRSGYKFVCSNTADYLVEYANGIGVSDNVIFLNGADEEDKAGLYKAASFVLFVSLHEGFGLPIIEAQASGTAVITSNTSCMPEIAGEGACLVDPKDPKSIANAMMRMIRDEQYKNSVIQSGNSNVHRFSWDKSAADFYDIICEVCG
jgi:glycosyltransferase involved in cell wall biosynthesis